MCYRCDTLRARKEAWLKRRHDRINAQRGLPPTSHIETEGEKKGTDDYKASDTATFQCRCAALPLPEMSMSAAAEIGEEKELDELLAVANKGRMAMIDLHRRFGDRVAYQSGKLLNEFGTPGASQQLKKVDKVKFPQMSLGLMDLRGRLRETVEVTLVGNIVHIGCKQFDLHRIGYRLRRLLDGVSEVSSMNMQSDKATATRFGIRFGSHILSWENAETLHAALYQVRQAKVNRSSDDE